MFSRFTSAAAGMAAAVSGNEIATKYDVEPAPCATGGHRFLWKVYNAKHRKSGVAVSVFVLDKEDPLIRGLAKTQKEALLEAFRREIAILKQFSQAKPMPCPSVLRLFQVFEETKKTLAFCSERVVFSLANALGHFNNLAAPGGPPPGSRNFYSAELLEDPHLSALETTRGAAQILDALHFGVMGGGSASGKRRLHLDVGPHSVYLTPDGQWRLGGWAFSLELDVNEASTLCPYFLAGSFAPPVQGSSSGSSGGDGASEGFAQPVGPRLLYCAPELTAAAQAPGQAPEGLTPQADMFSVGLLLAEIFQAWLSPAAASGGSGSGFGPGQASGAAAKRGKTSALLLALENDRNGNAANAHARAVAALLTPQGIQPVLQSLRSAGICVNPGLGQTITSLLNPTPAHRPAANTLAANPIFHEAGVSCLRRLDQLPTLAKRDPAAVASFVSGQLPSALPSVLPPRLRRSAVLAQVLAAAAEAPGLWPFALNLLFTVCEDAAVELDAERFGKAEPIGQGIAQKMATAPQAPLNPGVLAAARTFRIASSQQPPLPPEKQPPSPPEWLPRALLVVCQKASVLVALAKKEWIKDHLAPAVMVALGAGVPQLAEAALQALSQHANLLLPLLTAEQLQQDAVPGVCRLVVHSQHLSVRVSALKCVASILPLLDETTVVHAVLPTLRKVRDADHTPAVVMCSLGCYELIAKRLLPSALARHLLPGLVPLLDEKSLNPKQFEMVASRVTAVTAQIVAARRQELGQFDNSSAAASSSSTSAGLGGTAATTTSAGGLSSGGLNSSGSGSDAFSSVGGAAGMPPQATPTSSSSASDWASSTPAPAAAAPPVMPPPLVAPAPAAPAVPAATSAPLSSGALDCSNNSLGNSSGNAAAPAPVPPVLPPRSTSSSTPTPPAASLSSMPPLPPPMSAMSGFGDSSSTRSMSSTINSFNSGFGSSSGSGFGSSSNSSGGGSKTDDDPFASIDQEDASSGGSSMSGGGVDSWNNMNGGGFGGSNSGGSGMLPGSTSAAPSTNSGSSFGGLGMGSATSSSGFGDSGSFSTRNSGLSSVGSSTNNSSSFGGLGLGAASNNSGFSDSGGFGTSNSGTSSSNGDVSGLSAGMNSGFSGLGAPSSTSSPPPVYMAPSFGDFGAMGSGNSMNGSGNFYSQMPVGNPGGFQSQPPMQQSNFGMGSSGGAAGGQSVEQQMAETQRQIALLQSQLGQGTPAPSQPQPQGGGMGGQNANGNISIGDAFNFM